jgi:hypothetical protein
MSNFNIKTSINNKNDGVKIDVVTADQMSASDVDSVFNRDQIASLDAIPDLDLLTGYVYEILEYLEDTGTKKLMITNETAVKIYLTTKYADTPLPYGIITLLMDEKNRVENVERLLTVFERLTNALDGKVNLEDEDKKFTDEINNRYLYSTYGSKEAFEKALYEEIKKEQRKKNSTNIQELKNIGKVKIKH